MPKELFNQTVVASPAEPADDDRIAFGKPGVLGAKNILWSRFKQILQGALEWLDLIPQASDPGHQEGRLYYDSTTHNFIAMNDQEDVRLSIGGELWARLQNDTGGTLLNGKAGYITGSAPPNLTCGLADASDLDKSIRSFGLFTQDINDSSQGYITRYGIVRDIDTSAWPVNTILWVSADTPGELTDIRPSAPNYPIRIGLVLAQHSTLGAIGVDTLSFNGTDTSVNFEGALNGIVNEKPSISIVVDGGVIYYDTHNENEPTKNLSFELGGTRYLLNTLTGSGASGKARVALTPGTNIPLPNYIYIVESGGVGVLIANTTGFPSGCAPIGVASVQDVARTTNYGCLIFRRWNNAPDNGTGDGILQYVTKRIRLLGSQYFSGVAPTVTITTNPSAIDNLKVSFASGIVYQLHEQTLQAKDGTEYYVINHPTTPYLRITDLNEIDVDANGNTLRSNNTRYGLNLFLGQNSGDIVDRIYVMLPNGSYSSDDNAINDVYNYAVTSLPTTLNGTGFRGCRIVVNYSTSASGTFTNLLGAGGYQDERGFPLGSGGGGGASGAGQTEFSDGEFTVYNSSDATKILQFLLSGLSTSTTRTVTWPDVSGNVAVSGMGDAFQFGGQANGGYSVESFSATKTFDLNNGNSQEMVLTGNVTSLTLGNKKNGGSYLIYLIQDAIGSRTIPIPDSTFGSKTDNSVATFETAANAVNIINVNVRPNGTTYWTLETYTP